MTALDRRLRAQARSEGGFTMIIAIGVMLVTSLLLVVAFAAANGDIHLSHKNTLQKQAYYAALAGVQEYEYLLQSNPNYWETCKQPESTVPEEASERYEVKLLIASTAPKATKECETGSPFTSMIESKGNVANTFRIESTGCAGLAKQVSCKAQSASNVSVRSVVATFQVSGFLNFVYFTNYETEDPGLYAAPAGCEGQYYSQWSKAGAKCSEIEFANGDSVNGPMHTNDSALVSSGASFGRAGHVPADVVEINGGPRPEEGCGSATYNTATKCFTKGATLIPPESDSSLRSYVEATNQYAGVTHLVLNGSASTIEVTYFKEEKGGVLKETTTTAAWPENGLIFVQGSPKGGCTYTYESEKSDDPEEVKKETGCGNVYVSGTYSKSLTIAAENDVIINGNLSPFGVALGAEPTGTATLGLIATHYVRVYHPVEGGARGECSDGETNAKGSQSNPWIYAAILSTNHSFVVDQHGCGGKLGELHVYGAIAQDYRGIVGSGGGGGGTGYLKDYKYDERLATDEPPYFLAPLKAGWKIIRETAPRGG